MEHPFTANVAIFDFELTEVDEFPSVFHIVDVSDNGIIQQRTVILNCTLNFIGTDGCAVCAATAPDETGLIGKFVPDNEEDLVKMIDKVLSNAGLVEVE
jgi:hypothetical protein